MHSFLLGTVEFSVRSLQNFSSHPYFSIPVMEGWGNRICNLSRICQVSPPKVFTNQNVTCTCISVYLLLAFCGWEQKMLTVPTQMQLPKPRLRLEAASSALRHRCHTTALTQGSRQFPSGCAVSGWCWWLRHTSVLARQLQPAQPPRWDYVSRREGSFSKGCRFMGVNVRECQA